MTIDPITALAALFAASLLGATLIPLQSEVALAAALTVEGVAPWAAVLAATLGNTLGGHINWALGRVLHRYREARWFPASPAQLARAERWFARYGVWSLLLCWAPVIGDPLTVVAGALRTPFWLFTALTLPPRLARYALITWGVETLGLSAG